MFPSSFGYGSSEKLEYIYSSTIVEWPTVKNKTKGKNAYNFFQEI